MENSAMSYNSGTGRLTWDCEKASPDPVVLPDKTAVAVKLKSAADFAGNLVSALPEWTWTMDYSKDTTAPVVADLLSRTHPTFSTDTFEEDLGKWQNLGGGVGAKVERDTTTASTGSGSVKLTQQRAGGIMAAYVTTSPFQADSYGILSFDYRLPANVKLDFVVHMANGKDYPICFSDDPTGSIGRVPGVAANDKWRHAAVDLGALLRAQQPQGTLDVAYIYVADRNAKQDPVGATAWFDNVVIGKVGNGPPVFRWRAADTTGIAGYSYVLDQDPATVPPEESMGTQLAKNMGRLDAGRWFFHIRALDGAGNWGPATHYAVMQGTP